MQMYAGEMQMRTQSRAKILDPWPRMIPFDSGSGFGGDNRVG
jgi:hypothetical protein